MTDQPQPPRRDLKGRVAIITGAGSRGDGIGNGRASALLLAEAGANIVCVDLSGTDAERTVQMIAEKGYPSRAIAVVADVTKDADCKDIADKAMSEFGRIDILCNNVGIMGPKATATEVDMDEWDRAMRVNVSSMVLMAKHCIPHMEKNEGQWRGAIVNMSSVGGLRGGTPYLLYPTSKGAIVNMTRAMADHHAHQGIRVNCVCPGMVHTPMMGAGGEMSMEQREARKNRSLLKTEGNAYDVGAAVRFLASDEARWITGVILPVDAGTTCSTSMVVPDQSPYTGGPNKS